MFAEPMMSLSGRLSEQYSYSCLLLQCVLPGPASVWSPPGEPVAVLRAGEFLAGLPSVGSDGQHPRPAGRARLLPGDH